MNTIENTQQTNAAKTPAIINGVTFFHAGRGSWHFSGVQKNGSPFTLIEKVKGKQRAEKVASAIGASFKRAFNGVGLDGMGKHCVDKILMDVKMPTYKRINFSYAY